MIVRHTIGGFDNGPGDNSTVYVEIQYNAPLTDGDTGTVIRMGHESDSITPPTLILRRKPQAGDDPRQLLYTQRFTNRPVPGTARKEFVQIPDAPASAAVKLKWNADRERWDGLDVDVIY